MLDILQLFTQRRMVEAHGSTWMICYTLPALDGEIKIGRRWYLAVPCTPEGMVTPPCAVSLICVDTPIEPNPATAAEPPTPPAKDA